MNNRFKFRIWHEGKMHYNDFVITSTGYAAKIDEEFLGKCVFNQENLEFNKKAVVMQCTGLKDKNGKLIYDGDIVKIEYYDFEIKHRIGIVEWEDDGFCITYHNPKDTKVSGCSLVDIVNGAKQEVIGNIYENKELIDVGRS